MLSACWLIGAYFLAVSSHKRGRLNTSVYGNGGINQTTVLELDTPWMGRVSRTIIHHLSVAMALLVLPRRGGASLTILLLQWA